MALDLYGMDGATVDGFAFDDPVFTLFPSDPNWSAFTFEQTIPNIPTQDFPFGSPSGDVRVLNFPESMPGQQSIVPQFQPSPDYFDAYYGDPNIGPGFDPTQAYGRGLAGTMDLEMARIPSLPGADPLAAGPEGALGADLYYDDSTGAVVDASGQMVATPEEMAQGLSLIDETMAIRNDPSLSSDQKAAAEQSLWSKAESFAGTLLGRVLTSLTLGGIGLGISQLAAGDRPRLDLPPPSPPPAGVTATRDALNQALTTPGGVSSASLSGLFGPSATAGEDLNALFRMGIAGQRNLTDLALGRTAQEILADAEQAPLERLIRMGSLAEIPGLLGPTANLGQTLATGQGLSQMLQRTLAGAPQAGQTIVPAMLQDPIRGQLTETLQRLLAQGPEGATASDPVRAGLTANLQRLLTQGAPAEGHMLDDPIRAGLQDQVQRALAGDLPTTGLERQFRQEEAELRNRLMAQQGPGYESDHAGIQALQALRESQQTRREEFGRQTIASFAPQEFQRRTFGITNPQQHYLAQLGLMLPEERARTQFSQDQHLRQLGLMLPEERARFQFGAAFPEEQFRSRLSTLLPAELSRAEFGEATRQRGLAERFALSGLGRRDPSSLTTTLNTIVPISPILGLGTEAQERQQQDVVRQNLAISAFNADAAERARRAAAVGNIFGAAAGGILTQ